MNIESAMAVFLKQKIFSNFFTNFGIFFKQMAVACSLFTLEEGVKLLWAAFDMPMTVVPLKVALGLEKIDLWAFKKIITQVGYHGYFFKCPKIKFSQSQCNF